MHPTDSRSAELADPADKSRQKSCNACVRSKRRCDKRTPRCTRCAEKNFHCVYQNVPPTATTVAAAADPSSSQGEPLQAMDIEGNLDDGLPAFDFNTLDDNHNGHSSNSSNSNVNCLTPASSYVDGGLPTMVMSEGVSSSNNTAPRSTVSLGPNLDSASSQFDFNSVMDFLNADPVSGAEMQLWETPIPPPPPVPKSLGPQLQSMEFASEKNLEDMCCGWQPWQAHEPSSRLGHLVSFVKDIHISFVHTKQTTFLHRYLYRGVRETPRPLMAAYTALSAYAGRTEANKDWAMRAVCEGAAEILKGARDPPSANDSLTGHEKLARAQALCLLQTVRCFDGDISLRAQAERDMVVMERWLKDLEGLRDNLDDVHLLDEVSMRQRPPRSWELWIFNECVRRTLLMGNIFISLYEMLKSCPD
ncbi:hypothetical protein CCHL11_09666, partial [Colletotrichum chlorophyti]